MASGGIDRKFVHELSQPLNVISVATANLRNALAGKLPDDLNDYLQRKLDRIEEQIARAQDVVDRYRE
ncbi:histidine kinase dimerization/phospho-acceptor domain-containing protein [Novosphingobium jiangmenense]|uniref:histidine kinase n=1 Tax=Novosphingobium jiangmenense TaxID=2791981 RepID=A0ABS0HBS6_9SPHN|nr:histidine kinase dimerization/phospho-acceptor domain-containing protein [Novosphingobium jiangmenense]MBF9149682.1 hypothetical protein [Novosphingobium jiangmenense]